MQGHILNYLAYCTMRGMASSTIANKKHFLEDIYKHIPMDIRPLDLEDYLLKTYQTQSNKSFNNRVSDLRAFYNYLIRYEIYDKNPALGVEMKKILSKEEPVFSDEEVKRIITAPREAGRSRKEHAMYSLLFELYALTGIRRSEGIYLLIEDIREDAHYPYIILRNTKNGDDRRVPIPIWYFDKVKAYLAAYSPKKYLFEGRHGNHLTKSGVTKAFERRLKSLGLYSPKMGIHALRRAKISRLLMNHADLIGVSKLAGHRKIDTTMKYLYINVKYLQEQAEKDPLFAAA